MSLRNLQNIKSSLADHGLKVTHQRLVIYQELQDAHNHPAAEAIYEKIKKKIPSISLATVYKTLETFVEKGLINRVNTSESHMRYDGRLDNHNHMYCTKTGDIVDFSDDQLDEIISKFLKSKKIRNFNLKSFKLHVIGEKIDHEESMDIE